MLQVHVEFRGPDVQSVVALINPFTTSNWPGVVRLMRKLIPLDLRQRKENNVLISLSAQTVKETTKQI